MAREPLPVETTVWGGRLSSAASLGPDPLALETASVLFKRQSRVYGQLWLDLGGGSLNQDHAGASLPRPPGPQGLGCVVPSQQLPTVVAKNKRVKVCGSLSLYVSALIWSLGCVPI